MSIKGFKDADTETLWLGARVLRFRAFERVAMRKLQILDAAGTLNDLAKTPGNRLEKLQGRRAGQFSIRINDQWRLCFKWKQPDAYAVELTDHYQ